MRSLRSIVYLALLGTAGLIVVLINPLYIYAVISMFALLALAQQMSIFRMLAVIMSRYAKNVSRLRFEIRAKLHMGFRDYSSAADNEERHSKGIGCRR